MPTISPELATRLRGDYREEVCQALWAQIPEPLRLTRFDRESTADHPAFSWEGSRYLDLGPLPTPMQREIAWCVWRAIDQGGQVHHNYANFARRLRMIIDDDHEAGGPRIASLIDRPLEKWERAMAKATLRRGLMLSGMKPPRWALRTCYRLLHLAYDPREWWEQEVWDRRLDPRIPLRAHEPTAKGTINFLWLEQDWLRCGLQWHGKIGLETGRMRWTTVCERLTGLKHFSRFLAARGIDHPALTERSSDLRLLALDFLGYLRLQRAMSGPNHGQPLSDSTVVHVMGTSSSSTPS